MMNKRRLAFWILLAASIVGGIAVAVSLGLALSSLSGGPNAAGYDLLLVAMQSLPYLAAIVVLTVVVASVGSRVRFAVGGLALASGIVGGAGAGLSTLGSTLASIEPRSQPVALNSLLLAVWGVGAQLAPVALVLAAGTVVLAGVTVISRRVASAPAVVPAAA